MHTCDENICVVGLSQSPKGLLSRLTLVKLLLNKSGVASLSVLVDFGLVLLLDILWLVDERQVVFLAVSDRAHIELVFLGSEKTLHGDGEGELRGVRAIHGHHIVMTSVYCVGLNHSCLSLSFCLLLLMREQFIPRFKMSDPHLQRVNL